MSVPLSQFQVDPAAQEPQEPAAHGAVPAAGNTDTALPALGAWLELTCRMVPGVVQAFAGFDDAAREAFAAEAAWPQHAAIDAAAAAVARAVLEGGEAIQIIAAPERGTIYLARRLHPRPGRAAALVLKLPQPADAHRKTLSKLIDWSEAWLALVTASSGGRPAISDTLLDVLSVGLGAGDTRTAATAMAIRLATAAGASSVCVGVVRKDDVALVARSQTASFDPRTRANRAIVAAMEEAVDEDTIINLPAPEDAPSVATRAHETLQASETLAWVCTLPLRDAEGTAIGALTLMRHRGSAFNRTEQSLLEAAADAMARVLQTKREADRSLRARVAARLNEHARRLTGGGYLGRKFVAGALVLLAIVLLFMDGDYHVAAPATLEGRVERTLVAPIDGYVAEAPARAGDAVRAGDLLAVIDTRTLEFERRKWVSERAEAEKALRQAVAKLERAEAAINKARLGKASSQLELIEAQMARARITAPFAGIVISGDLSRALGAPVNRGDVLFEIAPLDDYRVELEVDERDIADVAPGQRGHLAPAALPGERRHFTVETVIGVAEAADGRNVFNVEAVLEGDVGLLRPGMRGVGKVEVGRRRLLWVWTHDLVDRVRLWLWSRVP